MVYDIIVNTPCLKPISKYGVELKKFIKHENRYFGFVECIRNLNSVESKPLSVIIFKHV